MYFTFNKAGNMPQGAFRGIEDGKASWLCDDWLTIANQVAVIKIVSCGQTGVDREASDEGTVS
jgi:hypothetical protein